MASRNMLPPWTRDETVLALWTAAGPAGEPERRKDRGIAELSDFLRSAGTIADRRFRNRHGVARKVWRFIDRIEGRRVHHARALETAVWAEFGANRERLEEAATMARMRIASGEAPASAPSRGPRPIVGDIFARREDIGAWLYLAVLDGLLLESRDIIVKIGRSNDVDRRQSQLNFGLPRPLGLRWRIARSWYFAKEMDAHQAEQAVLRAQAAAGTCVGGEFIRIPQTGLRKLAITCRAIIEGAHGRKGRHVRRRRSTSRRCYAGNSRQRRDTAAPAS